ncbi:hypothetical protein K488DRAFT_88964 [Vararia minispora EC-137]|uniref:Uncharacterized protein n=1 Tax=Vararia minispora EC-137 TaxID=1314806 RepID=A0ACB8QC05_9AGAM|nr:hypothetical protein K488DRAFT_88964 [Vararia minispora EC-137]
MATWAADVHLHPWFKMLSLKRTLSDEDWDSDTDRSSTPSRVHSSSSQDDVGAALATHPRKRLKSSGLEGGLASLSLSSPTVLQPSSVEESASAGLALSSPSHRKPDMNVEELAYIPSSLGTDAYINYNGDHSVVQAFSIEEPSPEVCMRTTSWYEPTPDRIIITDLDDSDDEIAPESVVLPSALEMLHARIGPLIPRVELEDCAQALALVPFHPRPFVHPQFPMVANKQNPILPLVHSTEPEAPSSNTSVFVDAETNPAAADLEPMDVEP